MLETEREVGWSTALKIDKNVWIKLVEIIIRRLKKYLNIENSSLIDLIEILTFRWSVEGWKYSINQASEIEVNINPNIKIERNKFMGLGDNICNFHFKEEID